MDVSTGGTSREDTYTQLLDFLRQNQLAVASALFQTLSADDALAILDRLAAVLDHELVALRNLTTTRAHNLFLTRDLATAHALELYLEIAHDLVRIGVRDRIVAQNLATVLVRATDRVNALPDELAFELVHSLDWAKRITTFLVAALERETEQPVDPPRDTPPSFPLTLQGIERLTPQTLVEEVVPFLQALYELQWLISALKGEDFVPPAITSIAQTAHLTVMVSSSMTEAVNLIRTLVAPQEQPVTELDIQEKSRTIERKKRELDRQALEIQRLESVLETSGAALKGGGENLRKLRLEQEQLKQEVKQAEHELTEQTIAVAVRIVNDVAPNLPEAKRLAQIQEVIDVLKVMSNSCLRITSAT
jgi:hypothetical protein